MLPNIPFLSLQPLVHLIPTTRIPVPPGNHMHMHVRYALASGLPVLHSNVEGIGGVQTLKRVLHTRHCRKEVGDFGGGVVGKARAHGERAYQDMTR